jgi:predicted DCC family thiol-disulfide oxidoreductase YuxK
MGRLADDGPVALADSDHSPRDRPRRFQGARAAFETMRRLPGLWGMIGGIGSFPPLSWLAEPVYRLIAHHRGQISRRLGLDICRVDRWDK